MSEELEGKHGVQSLEVGMGILKAMVGGKRSMMLKDIAASAKMPPSKAHRYLVSLIRVGLVEQDPLTSRYNIGPFALKIGLVAIDRLDRVRSAEDLANSGLPVVGTMGRSLDDDQEGLLWKILGIRMPQFGRAAQ